MGLQMLRLLSATCLAGLLLACQATDLIGVNDRFVDLMQADAAARQAYASGNLDPAGYGSTRETLRIAFAENGDRAVAAARSADTAANRVSFLGVAVRSYLKSGPIADTRIPDLADEGIAACRSGDLAGLNALPTTCGALHFANGQAINNQWERERETLRRQTALAKEQFTRLTAQDGARIVATFDGFVAALLALEKGESRVDWANADPDLRRWYQRQQDRAFCNARDTRLLLDGVVKVDGLWYREAAKAGLSVVEESWADKLSQRPGGFSPDACTRGGAGQAQTASQRGAAFGPASASDRPIMRRFSSGTAPIAEAAG